MAHFSWKPNEIHKILLVKNNGIAATVARRQKNCVRRNFQVSRSRNTPLNSIFDATPRRSARRRRPRYTETGRPTVIDPVHEKAVTPNGKALVYLRVSKSPPAHPARRLPSRGREMRAHRSAFPSSDFRTDGQCQNRPNLR